MNRKDFIYTLAASLVLGLGSCTSEDFWDTFDRTVDGPIEFNVGVEASPAQRAMTRTGDEEATTTTTTSCYYAMQAGTQVRLKVDGMWKRKSETVPVSKPTTCTTVAATETSKTINALSFTENETLYWDDYGIGDPENVDGYGNHYKETGLSVLGVAVDGNTSFPEVSDWNELPWCTIDAESKIAEAKNGLLTKDIIVSNNLTGTNTYKFADRNKSPQNQLNFQHVLSKITFNITASDGFVVDGENKFKNDPEVILTSADKIGNVDDQHYQYAKTNGTIDIENAEAKSDNEVSKVIAAKVKTDGATVTMAAVVYPGTVLGLDDNSVIARLNVDENIYYIRAAEIHKAMTTTNDFTTKAACNYVINVVVSKTHIGLTATVQDWQVFETAETINPVINISGNLGSEVTELTDKFDMFTLYRSTSINKDYLGASTLGAFNYSRPDAIDKEWTASPTLYWPDHDTHYHFRGVFPTGTKVENDGTNDYIAVSNRDNGDLLIGMPDKVEGVSCGSTDHTPVTDMSKYGICAREGKINLEFHYMMSQVEVSLTSSDKATDPNYVDLVSDGVSVKVELLNAYTQGKVLLEDCSVVPSGAATTHELNHQSGNVFNDYIVPQQLTFTQAGANTNLRFRITVTHANGTHDYYYADAQPIAVKLVGSSEAAAPVDAWKSGARYKYSMKVTKTQINATVTLADWEEFKAEEEVWF